MLNKLLTTTEKQNLHKRDVLMQDLLYYTLPLRKFTARGPRPWHRKRGCLAQKTGVPGTENGEFFRKPPSPKSMPAAHSMERSTPLGAQARIQCSLPPALARAAPPTPGYYIL